MRLRRRLEALEAGHLARMQHLWAAFAQALNALPDNPQIVERHGSQAFTIRSQALADRWDVFYHDFHAQYRLLTKLVTDHTPAVALRGLQQIVAGSCRTGPLAGRHFHPTVREHVRNLLDGD